MLAAVPVTELSPGSDRRVVLDDDAGAGQPAGNLPGDGDTLEPGNVREADAHAS